MINVRSKARRGLPSLEYFYDRDYQFYEEYSFRDMLVRERLRTERSQKPFILILIDIGGPGSNNVSRDIAKKIISALSSSTREIDIKGWYERNHSMGIIFTEINGIKCDVIKEKICEKLSSTLDSDMMKKITVTCHVYPEDSERDTPDKTVIDLRIYPDLSREISEQGSTFLKRTIDILGSIVCIILFLPCFLIIPILIKITSRGSVFFRQERTGMFGRKFTFLKYRTMHVDGNEGIHKEYVKNFIKRGSGTDNRQDVKKKLYKMEDDPRVTPIGNFLRKTSLDEIPQFFNVLKGDMSLVGPRPPIPYEMEHYDIWHRQRVLHVKPGITGIWQVEGRSLVDFDEMVRMDLKYAREWSILLDIKILLKTPMAVLSLKGAY